MRSIEQSGRSVEDAVLAALEALGVSRDQVDVEVLAEQSRGLLGILGHTEAKVRVTVKPGLADRAVEILQRMLSLMGLEGAPHVVADDADGVYIDIRGGSDVGLLIGKHGQTLAALQLITAMIANRTQALEERRKVILDAEGYRERRERTLRSMARSAADRARRTGREVPLQSLNARERRIVHLALADDPDVTTRSEGSDPDRSVIVCPRRSE